MIYAKATAWGTVWQITTGKYQDSPVCVQWVSHHVYWFEQNSWQLMKHLQVSKGHQRGQWVLAGKYLINQKYKMTNNNGKTTKKFDAMLKSIKQNIIQAHDRINLGMLMHANGTTRGKVLASLGIPTTACGPFLLWGGCGDKDCMLSHDSLKLTAAQVLQVKEILTKSSKKIIDKNEKSWMPETAPQYHQMNAQCCQMNGWQKTDTPDNNDTTSAFDIFTW